MVISAVLWSGWTMEEAFIMCLKMIGGLVGGDKDQAVTTDGGQGIIERPGLLTLTKSIH